MDAEQTAASLATRTLQAHRPCRASKSARIISKQSEQGTRITPLTAAGVASSLLRGSLRWTVQRTPAWMAIDILTPLNFHLQDDRAQWHARGHLDNQAR